MLNDRFSEREEKKIKGRLLTQAEKEKDNGEAAKKAIESLVAAAAAGHEANEATPSPLEHLRNHLA